MAIDTVDNPGGTVRIDLQDTPLDQRAFERVTARRTTGSSAGVTRTSGTPRAGRANLEEALTAFLQWAYGPS